MKKTIYILIAAIMAACTETRLGLTSYNTEEAPVSTSPDEHLLDSTEMDVEYVTSLDLPNGVPDIVCEKFTYEYGHFFVMDNSVNKTVFVFDSLGNFVTRLGERGRAQNEYVQSPTDFFVKRNQDVCVFERASQRILKFTAKGIFINADRFESFPYSACAINDGNYLCAFNHKMAKDGMQLALMSPDEDIIESYIELKENQKYVTSERTFFKNDDIVYHVPNLSDSILVFQGDSVDRVVKLNFDCGYVPQHIVHEIYDEDMNEYKNYKGVRAIMEYYETQKFRFVTYRKSMFVLKNLIDKETCQQICFSSVPFDGLFPPCTLYVKNDKMYLFVTKEDVKMLKDSMSSDKLQECLHGARKVVRDMFDGVYGFPIVLSAKLK